MKKTNKILLILDLDETLIHATEKKLDIAPNFQYDKYFIYQRPNLIEFLIQMNQHFKLAIWSSADNKYVNDIVNLIKPSKIHFDFIWARSRCTLKYDSELDEYVREKRLKKIKKQGFVLEKSLIIDDSPEKSKDNYGNAIYISPYKGDLKDNELNLLSEFLQSIMDTKNVRNIEKRNWRNIQT